jgi:hypothetical protein
MTRQANLSDNAKAFLARNPTLVGVVAGHAFYEHPTRGDESPLIVIGPDGRKELSEHWELPTMNHKGNLAS